MTTSRAFYSARGTAGARHSPRPREGRVRPPINGADITAKLGRDTRRDRDVVSAIAPFEFETILRSFLAQLFRYDGCELAFLFRRRWPSTGSAAIHVDQRRTLINRIRCKEMDAMERRHFLKLAVGAVIGAKALAATAHAAPLSPVLTQPGTRAPPRRGCRTRSRYTGRRRSSQAGAGPFAPSLAPALGLAAAPLAALPLAPSPLVGRSVSVTSRSVTVLPYCLRKPDCAASAAKRKTR